MKIREAKLIAGTLSYPSKMPGTSYSLPAKACILGSRLAQVPGTVCSTCYALKGGGGYLMGNAVKGQEKRLDAIWHPQWEDAMVTLLKNEHSKSAIRVDLGLVGVRQQKAGGSRYQLNEPGFHRWHDSGDLQSVRHLAAICRVCVRTPEIKHWLPTNELGMVMEYRDGGGHIPRNLTIRVSSIKINDRSRRLWPQTSSVFLGKAPNRSHVCPAPNQGHRCGPCRACWDRRTPHIAYEHH